jgi:aconitate hydratase
MKPPHNLFDTLQRFNPGDGRQGEFYSLPALEKAGIGPVSKLPVSIRLVLESVLRNCDGKKVTEHNVRALANWKPNTKRTEEIPFIVARIVLQDFTGVPLLVDLAAMRSAAARMGRNPKIIEPLVPVDLVVDHSVQVDVNGTPDAFQRNLEIEFQRNRERYQFLKWGMQAFDAFKVVPPGIGIIHQVNLEHLAKGVLSIKSEIGNSPRRSQGRKSEIYFPDTLVGTDSHTPMINGLGIVGWGVGGIEAEAGMLGQPACCARASPPPILRSPSRKCFGRRRLSASSSSFSAPARRHCRWLIARRLRTWRPNMARRWAFSRLTVNV